MWKILQQKKPDDYVIATGKQLSIRQFINLVSKKLNINIAWKGKVCEPLERIFEMVGF